MTEATNASKIFQLAQSLYGLYERFGEPEHLSFLDGCIYLCWSTTPARLDRYEEIPVDPKFLHYLGGTSRDRRKIYLHLYGYELVVTNKGGQIRAGIYDLAEACKEFK